MTIVEFLAYRRYESTRAEANNAMMGLLAGAQLAAHLLKLTEGSQRLLPDVFPHVEHIGRINLTSEAARRILVDADSHLGAMSVPYALALHEDFLKTCLELLEAAGKCANGTAKNSKLSTQHGLIETATQRTFSKLSLDQLTAIRLMRNCLIHEGGRVNRALLTALTAWDSVVEGAWTSITGRSPRGLQIGDMITFGHGELILTLAVTKFLAREANEMLQTAIPKAQWADLVIDDMVDTTKNALKRSDRVRRAKGLARHHYGAVGLTEQDILDAIARR
jgi:hypothetical protein